MEKRMSRTAAAFINILLSQVENAAQSKKVFERNTGVAIDAALRNIMPTPDILEEAEILKLAAAEVVSTVDDGKRHSAAKRDFVRLAQGFQKSLLELRIDPAARKRCEIDALGA
jgi:hypothetical protein